jgi:hypothetical protein
MPYLISILLASLLFFGFLLLTYYESRRGVRFFATTRYRFDTKMARIGYLIEHVDWGAFTAHLTKTSLNTIAHDAAHGTLMVVRTAERLLTRIVSALRRSRDGVVLSQGGVGRITDRVTTLTTTIRRRAPRANDIVRREEKGD